MRRRQGAEASGRRDDQIGLTAERRKVARARMADRNRRVPRQQQQRDRLADHEAAADDHGVLARAVIVIKIQQLHAGLGRARGEARPAPAVKTGHGRRGHAVDVLFRREQRAQLGLKRAQMRRKRPKNQHAVHRLVPVERDDRRANRLRAAVDGQQLSAHLHAEPRSAFFQTALIGKVVLPRADPQNRQSRRDPGRAQRRAARLQPFTERLCNGFPR